MPDPAVFYFGDSRLEDGPGAGHHLWSPHAGHVGWASPEVRRKLPWSLAELDGRLAGDPALQSPHQRGWWGSSDQHEGIVRLHQRDGWTAISFWDRSGDERHGSNSTLIASGEHTAREMVGLFERSFPTIWERITRRFQLVLPVEAPMAEPAPRLRIEGTAIRVATGAEERAEIGEVVGEAEEIVEGAAKSRAVVGGERRSG